MGDDNAAGSLAELLFLSSSLSSLLLLAMKAAEAKEELADITLSLPLLLLPEEGDKDDNADDNLLTSSSNSLTLLINSPTS